GARLAGSARSHAARIATVAAAGTSTAAGAIDVCRRAGPRLVRTATAAGTVARLAANNTPAEVATATIDAARNVPCSPSAGSSAKPATIAPAIAPSVLAA